MLTEQEKMDALVKLMRKHPYVKKLRRVFFCLRNGLEISPLGDNDGE